jgi:GNAT superfamily N-acetyltransferase
MEVTIVQTELKHADAIAELQRLCYPTLDPSHLITQAHIASHLAIFPEGQHVALIDDTVVGMSSSLRYTIDFQGEQHSFDDMIAGGFFTTHQPDGEWLYGADMSTHPNYRRRGIASLLYDARKALIQRLNLRGMVGGGMVPGYRFYKDRMSLEAYAAEVVAGTIHDPTLTPQLKNGYTVRGIIRNYLHDAELGNDATLIVWDNPAYRAS